MNYAGWAVGAIATVLLLLWPAPSQAATVSRADLQQAVFSVLLEIRNVQQHIIEQEQYQFLPSIRALLSETMQLHARIQAMPQDTQSSGQAARSVSDIAATCQDGGMTVSVDTTRDVIRVDGQPITAVNGQFICTAEGWVAGVCLPESDEECEVAASSAARCEIGVASLRVSDGVQIQSPGIGLLFGSGEIDTAECTAGEWVALP